ncbi:MAG: hypothetical protein SOU06_06570 [Bulleidia sp.]|nr:hypothetical protein [Erysipelotrichaceae bacterium]MDY2781182.1 hypothetical protein [Bulleidia sp.]
MKKKIFMLLLIASCLMTPIHILAEGCDTETATIVDEDTPKSGGKERHNELYIALLALSFGFLGAYTYTVLKKKRDEIDLQIDSVSMNEDGSLTVSLGYNNPCKEKIDIGQNNLKVTQGSAIILKNEKIETLDPGRHSNILTAVINEKTNLCWDINDKSIQVDGSKILKSIQGMENRA